MKYNFFLRLLATLALPFVLLEVRVEAQEFYVPSAIIEPAPHDPLRIAVSEIKPTLTSAEAYALEPASTDIIPNEVVGSHASIDPSTETSHKADDNVRVIEDGRGKETPSGQVCGRYARNGCERSGVGGLSRFAECSVTSKHSVGYVGGGGSLLYGEPRYVNEGTFGLDYAGWLFKRHTWLMWNHGAKHQGGYGAYATDGPRIIPE